MISFDRTFTCMILFLVINFKNGDFIGIEDEKVIMENNKHNIFCGLAKFLYPVFRISASDIKYLLFTPNNPKLPCDLQPNPEALNMCDFDPNLETKVITHGWIPKIPLSEALPFAIKDQYLEEDDYNVVVVNWTLYTQDQSGIGFAFSALNTVHVGLRLSSWMRFLQLEAGANLEKFHLLGHSLGGEVSSYAGKSICGVGRITYMDAAGPFFRFLPTSLRPSYNDALFVEAIHTNGAYSGLIGFGLKKPFADIDYFPNGGSKQTKCYYGAKFVYDTGETATVDSHGSEVSCNHNAGLSYILASFRKRCHFVGLVCDSYDNFQSGKCNSGNAAKCEMFVHSTDIYHLPKNSKCYLKTSETLPYCLK